MLSQICLFLKNWFNYNLPKYIGRFSIKDGVIIPIDREVQGMEIQENQYFRIVGSVFNDGIYKKGSEVLTDEDFDGAIWPMAVPPDFLALVKDIEDWQKLYGGVDTQNMSPYQSESFGGYSYSKSSGGSSSRSDSSVPTWQGIFADRLARYKKI